jgi:hypothetical protein
LEKITFEIIKKNVIISSQEDIDYSKDFEKKATAFINEEYQEGRISEKPQMGFELILRYDDLNNLKQISENKKQLHGYALSIHSPLNPDDPQKVDIMTAEGFGVARKILSFCHDNDIDLLSLIQTA